MNINTIKNENIGCKNSIKEIIKNKEYYVKQYGENTVESMIDDYKRIIKANNLITMYK